MEDIPPYMEIPVPKKPSLRSRIWKRIKKVFRTPKQRAFDRSMKGVDRVWNEWIARKERRELGGPWRASVLHEGNNNRSIVLGFCLCSRYPFEERQKFVSSFVLIRLFSFAVCRE